MTSIPDCSGKAQGPGLRAQGFNLEPWCLILVPLIHYLAKKRYVMLKSMTGFGRSEQTVGDKTFLVDIKSLNGKQFELSLKIPAFLKPFEFDIRTLLSKNLGRGTIDCTI